MVHDRHTLPLSMAMRLSAQSCTPNRSCHGFGAEPGSPSPLSLSSRYFACSIK